MDPGASDTFGKGEGYNSVDNPDGSGGVLSFAILDEGGTPATGLLAWSVDFNRTDDTGRCVFTAQISR